MKKIFWTSLKKYFEYFWENIFKVFEKYFKNYSVTPGPFFWEFVTESVNMKVKKVWWWWWGGGLFDFSVTPGPFFWEFDTEFWVQSLDLDLDLGLYLNLDTGADLELDKNLKIFKKDLEIKKMKIFEKNNLYFFKEISKNM